MEASSDALNSVIAAKKLADEAPGNREAAEHLDETLTQGIDALEDALKMAKDAAGSTSKPVPRKTKEDFATAASSQMLATAALLEAPPVVCVCVCLGAWLLVWGGAQGGRRR